MKKTTNTNMMMMTGHSKMRMMLIFIVLFAPPVSSQDYNHCIDHDNLDNACKHHSYPQVTQVPESLNDGEQIMREADANFTQFYEFAINTKNTTLLNQVDDNRKVIFNLEPCKGEVYLFIRKTRPCFPDPYSCLVTQPPSDPTDSLLLPQPDDCCWTHVVSRIDGTRDGASSFFELPLTSTRYYMSVYAKTRAKYSLLVMTDIGKFPRAGGIGKLHAYQTKMPLELDLSWKPAYFQPATINNRPIGKIKRYWVYAALLLDKDKRTNANVFLTSQKIMNTVCGLEDNTDKPFNEPNGTLPEACGANGYCNQTITGLMLNRRYVLNVVAETESGSLVLPGYKAAYSGLIVETDWKVERQEGKDSDVMGVIPALFGGVLGLTVTLYIWMVNWY